MFSGEASLLIVHLDGWEVALYTYVVRALFPPSLDFALRMLANIYFVLEAYLHTIQEVIGQECEK